MQRKKKTAKATHCALMREMDQLAAYGSHSDTDSDNDTVDRTGQARANICSQENAADSKITSPCNTKSDHADHLTETPGINFFGLTTNTSCSTSSVKGDSDEQMCSRLIHIHGQSVEIPDSDFWKNVSEAELVSSDLQNKHSKAQKRTFDGQKKLRNCVDKRHHSDFPDVKKSFQQHSETEQTTHESHRHRKGFTVTDVHDHRMDSGKSHHAQSDSKVKVYTVHPKISPHLNHHQGSRCACKESHRWAGHAGVINRIAWCGVPSFSHLIVSASMDSTLRVWNAWGQKQACVRTFSTHSKAVCDAQWSMDGRQVLSCSYDRTAAITDIETGQCQVQLEHSGFVSVGRFHPVTPNMIITGATDSIQMWDSRHPEIPVRILTHKEPLGQVQDLMFSHDGQELFSCGNVVTRESSDRTILAWDFKTGVILSNQIFQERYTVTRLCLHPSHQQFLAQTQGGYIAIFSTQRPYKMNKNKRFEGHKTAGYKIGLTLSHDGNFIYSGSSDGKLHCYAFNSGKKLQNLDCGGVLLDVAAHPVLPSVVAGATWDGDIIIFQ